MPEEAATDMVMRFTHGKKPEGKGLEGKDVLGECALQKDPEDDFMRDFAPALGYDDYSNFFEVLDFSFSVNVSEDSDKGDTENVALDATSNVKSKTLPRKDDKGKKKSDELPGQFGKWRSMGQDEYDDKQFGVDLESFTFKRNIDSASPIFFMACCSSWTFSSAALVKRVSRGELGGSNRLPVGYLRFEFKDVMIKSLKWADGDMVTEDCEIVCKEFRVKYKPQTFQGDLKPAGDETWWSRDLHTDPNRDPVPKRIPSR